MENLSTLLNQPEYVHTAINHFPLTGLLVGALTLVVALITRNALATRLGLTLVCLLSLSAWPVYEYGEAGFDRVLSMADENGQAYLRYHQHLAERWVFLYYLAAGLAALGFGLSWKWPRSLVPFSLGSLVVTAASLIAGLVIAHAGGQVRHREFRYGPPPVVQDSR
jgi:hypothetical protein